MSRPTYQKILGPGRVRKGHTVDEFIALAKYYNDLFGLPENLVPAAMMKESEFDHLAKSKEGPMGLMQLAGKSRYDTGVQDAYDPEESIMGGAAYYRSMMDNYPRLNIDNIKKLSTMYTEGPGAGGKMIRGEIPYNHQSINHYGKIKDALKKIKAADEAIASYREPGEMPPLEEGGMVIDINLDDSNYDDGYMEDVLTDIGFGKPSGLTLQQYMALPKKARDILEKFKRMYPEPIPSVVELPEEFDPLKDLMDSVDNIDTVPIRW
jgi:hypothetical protein